MTTLNAILDRINDRPESGANKVAADAGVTAPALASEQSLLSTIQAVTQKSAAAAPAASSSAIPALDDMAAKLAGAENESLVALSKLAGAAFCDSFMARASSFKVDETAKIAADAANTGITTATIEKVAHDAYLKGIADAEKKAQDEYQRGLDETLEGVHKIASEVHLFGQDAAKQVIAEMAKGA